MIINDQVLTRVVEISKSFGVSRLILFGSALDTPDIADDLDLACEGVEGWKLYELGATIENEIGIPLDLVPLSPPTRFTKYIESKGKQLI